MKLDFLRNDLNQQRNYFTSVLKLVTDEQKKHKKFVDQLESGVSVIALYDDISNLQKKVLEDLNKLKHKKRLNYFFIRNFFNLQKKVWKKASGCIGHSNTASNRRNKSLKGSLDQIKDMLELMEKLFENSLIEINFRLKSADENDKSEKTNILSLLENISMKKMNIMQDLKIKFQKFVNHDNSLVDDVKNISISLENLFLNYDQICSNMDKSFAEG